MTASPAANKDDNIFWNGPGNIKRVIDFQANEGLSQLGTITVTVISDEPKLATDSLLFKSTKISIEVGEGLKEMRLFQGLIISISQGESAHGNIQTSTVKEYFYKLLIRPRLWLLTQTTRSETFIKTNVQELVSTRLKAAKVRFKWNVKAKPRYREHAVQYAESDFAFLNRLLEDEGITYYQDHEADTVVFCDRPDAHPDCRPFNHAHYRETHEIFSKQADQEAISTMTYRESVGAGAFSVNDYNHEAAKTPLFAEETTTDHRARSELSVYEHPADHGDHTQGQAIAKRRLEAAIAGLTGLTGSASCRSFAHGHCFNLQHHWRKDLNRKWLLVHTQIAVDKSRFICRFQAIPASTTFRPQRRTPIPKEFGIQTAKVTGPKGAKVYLDDLGRCKLRFHWEREGSADDRSSRWVRVNNGYAGRDYGIQFIPRVGTEVLVQFIDGNPDRPVVVGRAYNDADKPPLGPSQKWQNIVKSIKDNHLLFDDEDGKELLQLRAQRNMHTHVENDQSILIKHDRSLEIQNNDHQIVKVNRFEEIGNDWEVVNKKGKIAFTANRGGLIFKCGPAQLEIKPGFVKIRFGGNEIKLSSAGISINGSVVRIN